MVIYGKGQEHDRRLKAVFERLESHGLTLKREKCHLGKTEIKWFGYIFSSQGMSKDPEKVEHIMAWGAPKDKAGIKSVLQTAQFCAPFLRPGPNLETSTILKPCPGGCRVKLWQGGWRVTGGALGYS